MPERDARREGPVHKDPHADPSFDYSSGAAELRGEVYRPPEYLEYLEKAAIALKTVRLIVYSGMTGFVILAIYGFVLVFRLTSDVHTVVSQTQVMTQQMQAMSRSMANLNQNIAEMNDKMGTMTISVGGMDGAVTGMASDIRQMSDVLTLVQHSARNIDQSFGPFMGTMNRLLPFGGPGSTYGGAPPYARLR